MTDDHQEDPAKDAAALASLPPRIDIERIRKLEPADLEDLCEATEAAIEHKGGFGWLQPPERWKLENFWNGVALMPERWLWVARVDGRISGSVQLQRMPRNNEAQQHIGRITTLFLAPWARGLGISLRLLTEAEEAARAADLSVLSLDVRETQTSAIALIESLNYQRIGTHPYYARVDGEWIPGHYFYKLLDANP